MNQEEYELYTQEPEYVPGPAMSAEEKAALASAYADDAASDGTLVDSHQDWGNPPAETQAPVDDEEAGYQAAQRAFKRVAEEEEAGRAAAREALAKRHRVPSQESEDPLSFYFGNVPLVKFGDLDPMGRELVRARAQYRVIRPEEDVNTFGFLCDDCNIAGQPVKAGVYPAPGQLLYPLSLMEPEDAAKYRALIGAVHKDADVPPEALVALAAPPGHRIVTREVYRPNVAMSFNQIQAGRMSFVDLHAPNAAPAEPVAPRPAPLPIVSASVSAAPLPARVIVAPDVRYTGRRFGRKPREEGDGIVHEFENRNMGVRVDRAQARAREVVRRATGKRLGTKEYPVPLDD